MADRFSAELARELRRPFLPEEVRFKVQRVLGENKGAQVVPYIDARSVIGRLNRLAPGRWRAVHEALPLSMRMTMPDGAGGLRPARHDKDGRLEPDPTLAYRCTLTICGARFEDVGEGEDPKSAHADSLKRAAVRAGIGESLYVVGLPSMWVGSADGQLRTTQQGRPMLDERSVAHLRTTYARWLSITGRAAYGDPLEREPRDGGGVLVALPGAAGGAAPLPERIAAAARALPGELSAESIAALAALLAEREEVAERLEVSDERGAELIATLEAAAGAGWSAAELEELLGRALRAPVTPAERRATLLARLARAAAA
jgi:hypothetical protein